jgi:hypothetical protein
MSEPPYCRNHRIRDHSTRVKLQPMSEQPRKTTDRHARPQTVLMIVASAMFMEQLDGTVLATALQAMAHSFDADPLHMNIALTSYLLTLRCSSRPADASQTGSAPAPPSAPPSPFSRSVLSCAPGRRPSGH